MKLIVEFEGTPEQVPDLLEQAAILFTLAPHAPSIRLRDPDTRELVGSMRVVN